jgi:hypothetical protein
MFIRPFKVIPPGPSPFYQIDQGEKGNGAFLSVAPDREARKAAGYCRPLKFP